MFLFSGSYNVMINPGKGRKMNFRVKSKAASKRAPGILCEKGNTVFTSVRKYV